ncbi:hypothetical protein EJ03DRAFT_125832 [Teratosphaeria nubilosa]|uniref:Uncharacterized protein n=1 Tax=Teratosphaeria nubilosa TaxID=161662 RepID=A0A6G1LK76_9PEZI|nr:hypothetical protein EJ03DRAFT_125832 [Teratosphaeria nubilosa]
MSDGMPRTSVCLILGVLLLPVVFYVKIKVSSDQKYGSMTFSRARPFVRLLCYEQTVRYRIAPHSPWRRTRCCWLARILSPQSYQEFSHPLASSRSSSEAMALYKAPAQVRRRIEFMYMGIAQCKPR